MRQTATPPLEETVHLRALLRKKDTNYSTDEVIVQSFLKPIKTIVLMLA